MRHNKLRLDSIARRVASSFEKIPSSVCRWSLRFCLKSDNCLLLTAVRGKSFWIILLAKGFDISTLYVLLCLQVETFPSFFRLVDRAYSNIWGPLSSGDHTHACILETFRKMRNGIKANSADELLLGISSYAFCQTNQAHFIFLNEA